MARKKKYTSPAPLSLREMIRNMIRTTCRTYNGKDFTTTLGTVYFLMHGTNKAQVFDEISKWVDLNNANDETPIVLPCDLQSGIENIYRQLLYCQLIHASNKQPQF